MDAEHRRELLAEVRQANNCSHPIRISGEMVNRATGEVARRGLTVACKDRRRAVCPTCSYLYKADAFILASAGLIGGKGIDESVVGHPRLFVTLTAPSFGPVHRITQSGQCHRRKTSCPHEIGLNCSSHHTPDNSQLGSPLCFACFDYAAAVEWNAHANRLRFHSPRRGLSRPGQPAQRVDGAAVFRHSHHGHGLYEQVGGRFAGRDDQDHGGTGHRLPRLR